MTKLGEFELLLLMAILRQADAPYANRVRDDLEKHAGRNVTRGALYRTIDRLTEKGFLTWEIQASGVPERGGHPMRRLLVTEEGRTAVREARDVLVGYFDRLDAVLDEA